MKSHCTLSRTLFILFALLSLLSCNDFEGLENRVDELENKVSSLEAYCSTLNSNINSLKSVIDALSERDYVESVRPVTEEGLVVAYDIKFSKQGNVTIYTNANAVSPIMGVKEWGDAYYWTMYGDWVFDSEGKRIGTEVVPVVKNEDGALCVSFDSGTTWIGIDVELHDNGYVCFTGVSTDDDNACFTLKDGTEIVLPLSSNSIFSRIQSLSYIPRYSDGKVPVFGNTAESGYVALDFSVSPKSVVPKLESIWRSAVMVKAVKTMVRAVSYIDMPVFYFSADAANGVITVYASTKNLSKEFFEGKNSASLALHITDGDYDITSDYVCMFPLGVRVVAHRGYWNIDEGVENSMKGLLAADSVGVWGCELDIWETKDSVIILHHDKGIDGKVIEETNYSEIEKLALPNGEPYPTLREYLLTYRDKCFKTKLIIELKPHSTSEKSRRVARNTVAMVKELGLEDCVEYISFSSIPCDEVIKNTQGARVSYVSEKIISVGGYAAKGYTGIDIRSDVLSSNPWLVTNAHSAGMEVNSWTVNDEDVARSLITLGADVITTDIPERIQEIIVEMALAK